MTMSVSLIYLPARTLSLAVCIKSIKMHLFWNLAVMHAYLCYFFVWICVIYVCLCTYMWNNSWFQSLSDDSRHCCGMFTACSNEVFQSFGYIQWPPRDWVLLSPVIAPLSKADPPCVYKREPVFFVMVERVTSCSTRRPWVNVVAMALMTWNLVSNKGHMRKISKASFLTYWVSTVPPSDWLPPWENQVRAPRPLWHNTDTRVDKICPKKMSI